MLEYITAKLGMEAVQWSIAGVGGIGVAWALKKIPNATIKAKFGMMMYGLGVASTLGLSKWSWTKNLWNKTIEPWIIDAIDNIIGHGIAEFIRGLRSDD